ncbi:hypothetical protein J6590_000634, partial [Homalodisca vitripennis]
ITRGWLANDGCRYISRRVGMAQHMIHHRPPPRAAATAAGCRPVPPMESGRRCPSYQGCSSLKATDCVILA